MTPWSLSSMMARMQLGSKTEIEAMIAERGFITMSDPACGVGNMAIAFAMALKEEGFNFQQVSHFTIQDIDPFMSQCAYVQCSLFGMPAIITTGDSLRMTETARWFTPLHVTGGWDTRLRGDDAVAPLRKIMSILAEVEQLLDAEPVSSDQPIVPEPIASEPLEIAVIPSMVRFQPGSRGRSLSHQDHHHPSCPNLGVIPRSRIPRAEKDTRCPRQFTFASAAALVT